MTPRVKPIIFYSALETNSILRKFESACSFSIRSLVNELTSADVCRTRDIARSLHCIDSFSLATNLYNLPNSVTYCMEVSISNGHATRFTAGEPAFPLRKL